MGLTQNALVPRLSHLSKADADTHQLAMRKGSPNTGTIRAYHLLSAQYGLEDLRHRRLKIARINDLNDPFELSPFNLSKPSDRAAFRKIKNTFAANRGVLCFSLSWDNPLLWSHYADRHKGVALGFDIHHDLVRKVSYVEQRYALKKINEETAIALLFSKYKGWEYEQEVRIFTSLEDRKDSGHYFVHFNEQLALRDVIVGSLSTLTRQQLQDELGDLSGVTLRKARLAFNTFRIVTDHRGLS